MRQKISDKAGTRNLRDYLLRSDLWLAIENCAAPVTLAVSKKCDGD